MFLSLLYSCHYQCLGQYVITPWYWWCSCVLVCHCITSCFVHGSVLVYRGFDCAYVIICFILELYIDVMMVIKLLLASYYYLHISFILGLFVDSHAHNRVIIIDIIVISFLMNYGGIRIWVVLCFYTLICYLLTCFICRIYRK